MAIRMGKFDYSGLASLDSSSWKWIITYDSLAISPYVQERLGSGYIITLQSYLSPLPPRHTVF